MPATAPAAAWRGPLPPVTSFAPLLVDAAGSLILVSAFANTYYASVWTAAGEVTVGAGYCGGTCSAGFPVILPGGCVAAPTMTYTGSSQGLGNTIFQLIAVPGATADASACAAVVPWTTQTLEPFEQPFNAEMTTPIFLDDGRFVTSVDANSEFICNGDESCYTYTSFLAVRGGGPEQHIGLASCNTVQTVCPGSGPYQYGVVSGAVLFAYNPAFNPKPSSFWAIDLDSRTPPFQIYAPAAMAAGCVLAASTEGAVFCVTGGNLTAWSSTAQPPPLSLGTLGGGLVAIGAGPGALVVAASGATLVGATQALSLIWSVTLYGAATALVRDADAVVVATTAGLAQYRAADGALLWSSDIAAGATTLVAAAPYALAAIVGSDILYLSGPPSLITSTPSPSGTPSLSDSGSPTPTGTPPVTPSGSRTGSCSVTPTITASMTATPSLTATPSITTSVTPSQPRSFPPSVTLSRTPSQTASRSPSPTNTPSYTGTPQPSPTASASSTAAASPAPAGPTPLVSPSPGPANAPASSVPAAWLPVAGAAVGLGAAVGGALVLRARRLRGDDAVGLLAAAGDGYGVGALN